MNSKLAPVFAAMALVVALPACSVQAPTACAPEVSDAWIRMMPGGMPMHGGFARIENACPTVASVVSASSARYGDIELHETTNDDGVSRMRQIHELPVPAQGVVELKPGGLHLMLMQPAADIVEGEKITITLKLADGREIPVEFTTRAAAGEAGDEHAHGH
ncbi:copper chaperone PCu(A)C [Luteimonas sp. e5]